MTPDPQYVGRHIDRDPNALDPRTVYDFVTAVLGLIGFALFGIGLEVGGGVWPAIGFFVCIAVVAVSGFNLAPPMPPTPATAATSGRASRRTAAVN